MDRSVNINLDNNQLTAIAMSIGSWDKLWNAIGYLSTWNTNYPFASIFHDRDNDLVCVYKDASNNKTYVIGAVWHEDHYGFHS